MFSGSETAIVALEARLRAEKISFHHLPVSTAFHSQIIKDSQQPFFRLSKDAYIQSTTATSLCKYYRRSLP